MVMKTDEAFKKEDGKEPCHDPHEYGNDRILQITFSMCMHFEGMRQEIKDRNTDHDACNEAQGDLHSTVRQPTPERYETTKNGYTKHQDE